MGFMLLMKTRGVSREHSQSSGMHVRDLHFRSPVPMEYALVQVAYLARFCWTLSLTLQQIYKLLSSTYFRNNCNFCLDCRVSISRLYYQ